MKRKAIGILLIIILLSLSTGCMKKEVPMEESTISNTSINTSEVANTSGYDRVKIEFLSDMMGFKSVKEFETTESLIVEYIDSTIKSELAIAESYDLENNHTNQYRIELSDEIGGYSCVLYYDTLYDKAYIEKDGGLYEIDTDFARYIDSFLENISISFHIDDDVMELFQKYGWTLDYQINTIEGKLRDISMLSGFDPNTYYFAYNNELSKDIDLDMSGYPNDTDINIEIYRVYESMPEEFYPIQDCRGIIVKDDDKIIGAFISAGRHNTFDACSLNGNSFGKVIGKTFNEWISSRVHADDIENRLSRLEPEQVIEEYFKALDSKDSKTATYCISKKSLLGNLTANILNNQLFNEKIGLPLVGDDIGEELGFENMKSAKLLKVEQIAEPSENTKIFRVFLDLQYKKEFIINNGEQYWDCYIVYESPQTGWKIEEFGH